MTHFLCKRLGNRIAVERRFRDVSQEKLALLSAIDRTYLARIEEGKANPSIKILHKICRRLNMKLSDLLSRIGG